MLQEKVIAILTPKAKKKRPPNRRPIARALLSLQNLGVTAIFGDNIYRHQNRAVIDGSIVYNNSWQQAYAVPIDAVHDRFPSQIRKEQYQKSITAKKMTPMANPLAITMLCRDKLKTQEVLQAHGITMPEVCADYKMFQQRLEEWGGYAFAKPQFGALGISVQSIRAGQNIPFSLPGVVPNTLEPTIIQRGITPPKGWAGMCIRILAQRRTLDDWILRSPVLRRSRVDPVVNAARGAEVLPAKNVLSKSLCAEINRLCLQCCQAIASCEAGEWAVELGIDMVLDDHENLWVIEINSRPRGRLEVLADQFPGQFAAEHTEACLQPLRFIADKIRSVN